jgi:hypothetical protein
VSPNRLGQSTGYETGKCLKKWLLSRATEVARRLGSRRRQSNTGIRVARKNARSARQQPPPQICLCLVRTCLLPDAKPHPLQACRKNSQPFAFDLVRVGVAGSDPSTFAELSTCAGSFYSQVLRPVNHRL